jgi:DNA invertase Pin-like site-specific DNA recombinase
MADHSTGTSRRPSCRFERRAGERAEGKLDRLARNVAFISNLMESGVEFTAVDFPQANRLTVHILAAVAGHEATMISQRTKAALAAAKGAGREARRRPGLRLVFTQKKGAVASAVVRSMRAAKRAADLLPVVRAIQADGASSLRKIAAVLNARGIPAARGGAWSPMQFVG